MAIESRKLKSGSIKYRVIYYEKSKQKKSGWKETKGEAQALERKIKKALTLQRAIDSTDPATQILNQLGIRTIQKMTVDEFQHVYLNKRLPEVQRRSLEMNTLKRQLYSLRLFANMFPGMQLCLVTPHELELFKEKRFEKVSARGVNKDFAELRTVLKKAYKWNLLASPIWEKVDMEPTFEKLPQYLTKEELDNTETQFTDPVALFIFRVMKYTGIRRAEMARLVWGDFPEEFTHVKIKGKSKRERIIPIHYDLKPHLEKRYHELSPNPDDPVLEYHPDTITMMFSKAMQRAGCKKEGGAVHVLRHSLGTYLADIGTPLHEIAAILGHSNLKMAQRYSQIRDKRKRETLNKLYKETGS